MTAAIVSQDGNLVTAMPLQRGHQADDRPRNNTRRSLFDREIFDDPLSLAGASQLHHSARVIPRSSFHKAGCTVIRRGVGPRPTPSVLVDRILLATVLTAGSVALLLCAQLP